ncbi:hypothetical protein HCA68_15585 [Listeria booriae]|uniref:hypothetical protein n=1 Tax=Listeria booriae TaxID=1552123 RepID=UPI001624CCB4|nr:hypothetical protein [Listeria booriae]MBC1899090.1 hypothetical protein [Listeria booriae]
MIKGAIEQVKEIKKITADMINIPLTYLLFLGACFLLWKPRYIELINVSGWMPNNIEEIILGIFNIVYGNIATILTILFICLLLLTLLDRYTPIFSFFHYFKVEYANNTTVVWNQYSAMRRLLAIIVSLITQFWIYYFTINVLFNPYDFAGNFFLNETPPGENSLILSKYLSGSALATMNLLYVLNMLCAIYFIFRAIFEIKFTTNKSFLKSDDLSLYIKINNFYVTNSTNERLEMMILKREYRKKQEYLLVRAQLSQVSYRYNNYNENSQRIIEEIPNGKRSYEVLDRTDNLSDIVYYYEALKEKNNSQLKCD